MAVSLLVEETRENHRPVASHWQTLSHNVYRVHLAWAGFELTTLVVIGTDCIGGYKSNYQYDHDHDDPLEKYNSAQGILTIYDATNWSCLSHCWYKRLHSI
jgi:hypothetical protein